MKLLFVILLALPLHVYCQNEIGVSPGGTFLIGLDKSIDRISSSSNGFYFGHNFNLNNDMYFYSEIMFVNTRYIMDGLFFKDTENTFHLTPTNYKQSIIKSNFFQIPIFVKGIVSGNLDAGKYSTFSVGPIFDYAFDVKQEYKVDNIKKKEQAPIDNRLNARIGFEVNNYTKIKGSNTFINMGFGSNYHLTEYLNNGNKSFKPLTIYLKLGISILSHKKSEKLP